MKSVSKTKQRHDGFSIVEVIITMIVATVSFAGLAMMYDSITRLYRESRQLNEVYAVLSSCPEIDRALQYDSISSVANCFPNNVFEGEGLTKAQITYSPSLTVKQAVGSAGDPVLSSSDVLYGIPDAKVVDISVNSLTDSRNNWKIRLLVSRNGIGQQ